MSRRGREALARLLLVDPVALVGRIDDDWISELLVIRHIGHVDIDTTTVRKIVSEYTVDRDKEI